MHEAMMERAQDLGRLIGQTSEYKTLQRAREGVSGDRELTGLLEQLARLESDLARSVERGEEPAKESADAYERAVMQVEANSLYQSFVAAQGNFDKLLARVNAEIGKGMESASRSRIILPD